jgi:hypothetical protein
MSYLFHLPFVTVSPPSSWQRRTPLPTMSRHRQSLTKRKERERGGKKKTRTTQWQTKDVTAQDLKAAHQSNAAAEKEDDRKPAAVTKKMDDSTTLKMEDPPTKHVNEEDQTDDKKPAAKENVQDKKKRRNAKLPLHPNSTRLLPKSIGKSPNMDLDLEDT